MTYVTDSRMTPRTGDVTDDVIRDITRPSLTSSVTSYATSSVTSRMTPRMASRMTLHGRAVVSRWRLDGLVAELAEPRRLSGHADGDDAALGRRPRPLLYRRR